MPKYYNTKEFKALSQEWQARLKETGFSDIEITTPNAGEGVRSLLRGRPRALVHNQNARKINDFFAKLDGFLAEAGAVLPPVDKSILELWSQGSYIVDIAKACACNERTVRRRLSYYKVLVMAL